MKVLRTGFSLLIYWCERTVENLDKQKKRIDFFVEFQCREKVVRRNRFGDEWEAIQRLVILFNILEAGFLCFSGSSSEFMFAVAAIADATG